ncbi:hypothetical protein JL722_9186 [Aureococcus anophagefferens]|nr:hypothetical protein JL722_9186 [Aureococcus anophagefferens]
MLGAPTMLLRPIILVAALARAVELDWIAQFSVEDKTFTAAGDVVFAWTGDHNVEKMASFDAWESCDFSGATLVGESSGATASGDDGETAYYACSAERRADGAADGGDVAQGQQPLGTAPGSPRTRRAATRSARTARSLASCGVEACGGTTPPSQAPTKTYVPPTAAPSAAPVVLDWVAQFSVSDKTTAVDAHRRLVFAWTGDHNVEQMASRDHWEACDFAGARLVSNASGAVAAGAAGSTSFYACSVGKHCTFGQKVAVDWTQPVPAPTACADRDDWYKKAQPRDCPGSPRSALALRGQGRRRHLRLRRAASPAAARRRRPGRRRPRPPATPAPTPRPAFAPGAKTPEPSLWPTYGAVEVDSVDAEVTYRGNVNKKRRAEVEGAPRLDMTIADDDDAADEDVLGGFDQSSPASSPRNPVAQARVARPAPRFDDDLDDGAGDHDLLDLGKADAPAATPPPGLAPISLDDLPKFDASEPLRAPDSPFDDDGPTASIRGSMTAFERHIAASSPKNKNLA